MVMVFRFYLRAIIACFLRKTHPSRIVFGQRGLLVQVASQWALSWICQETLDTQVVERL
jgi:hypothetical protein